MFDRSIMICCRSIMLDRIFDWLPWWEVESFETQAVRLWTPSSRVSCWKPPGIVKKGPIPRSISMTSLEQNWCSHLDEANAWRKCWSFLAKRCGRHTFEDIWRYLKTIAWVVLSGFDMYWLCLRTIDFLWWQDMASEVIPQHLLYLHLDRWIVDWIYSTVCSMRLFGVAESVIPKVDLRHPLLPQPFVA